MKTIVKHSQIGTIEITTRTNSRGISYRVSSDYVRITTHPLHVNAIFPLSEERILWILEMKQKLALRSTRIKPFTPTSEIQTNKFQIKFKSDDSIRTSLCATRIDNELIIAYTSTLDFTNETKQKKIKELISYFLKKEATLYLKRRLTELAHQYGFIYHSVKINGAHTRWGSCSVKKQINLSYYLMLLPDELIDFVLVHELCHTRIMNHGVEFKQLMQHIFPDYATLTKSLKEQHTL